MKDFAITAEHLSLGREAQALVTEIAGLLDDGRAALAVREAAVTAAARASLRIQGWRESANAARRSLEATLAAYAVAQALPRGYADRFFPAPRARGKARPDDTGAPPPVAP